MRDEIANLEDQRESSQTARSWRQFYEQIPEFVRIPPDLRASLIDIEARLKHQQSKLEESGPPVDPAKQKLDFFTKDYKGRLGDYRTNRKTRKRYSIRRSAGEAVGTFRASCLAICWIAWSRAKSFTTSWLDTRSARLLPNTAPLFTCSNCARRWSRRKS